MPIPLGQSVENVQALKGLIGWFNQSSFEVTDEGIGIAPENRERLFDPFFTNRVVGLGGAIYRRSGTEFVKMVTTQRGFQASSRTITVTDTLLEEVANLKR